MSRLIDADEVIKFYANFIDEHGFDLRDARFSIRDIEMNLSNIPTVNQWIPVSERLPEMYERVLISVKEDGHNERIELAFLAQPAPRNIRFRAIPHWYEIDDVLAWMPLPKPYEVEEE